VKQPKFLLLAILALILTTAASAQSSDRDNPTPISSGDIIFDGQSIVGKRPFEICHAGVARTFQLNAAFETKKR